MTVAPDTLNYAAQVLVGAGGTPLSADLVGMIHRVVVDQHANQPAMFEIHFYDDDGQTLTNSSFTIGAEVQIKASSGDASVAPLITGEVTSIGASYRGMIASIVVRGYSKEHRLHRGRKTKAFLKMKDSDIAKEIAGGAGLTVGQVDETQTAFDHVAQVNETDWGFLQRRAREIGYDVSVADGKFNFCSGTTASSDPHVKLARNGELWSFNARLSGGTMAPKVEVRLWDPLERKAVAEQSPTATSYVSLSGNDPSSAAQPFAPKPSAAAAAKPNPALGDLGPAPAADAFVVHHRPAGVGAAASGAATAVAKAYAQVVGGVFGEAEGDAIGNPAIKPGATVDVSGFADAFNGSWTVTKATHVFDIDEGGYRTYFGVHGREDRSLLGLATETKGSSTNLFPGIVCGVVTNNNDPVTKGRVKVALPWLDPQFESDWAPVAQFSASKQTGALFLPAVGDEVLVGFEFGDPRRPYVLGSLIDNASAFDLGAAAVKATGETTQIVRSGFASQSGNQLVFCDDVPPGEGNPPPNTSQILLGTKSGNIGLAIDQKAGSITITCKPSPPASQGTQGTVTIECGDTGTVNIKSGSGGTVNIESGGALSVKAQSDLTVQSSASVTIKGTQIKLN